MKPRLTSVLFDFGHTLFDTASSIDFLLACEPSLDRALVTETWLAARDRSRTTEEMAKGRDLSPEAHRRCWLTMFEPFDRLAPGLAERLYEHEISPRGWVPYVDTIETLRALRDRGIGIGVVSDAGWDIRPVFSAHEVDGYIDVFTISYEHGVTKPSRTLFEHACAALGAGLDETLMVGDNHRTDGGAAEHGLVALVLPLTPSGEPRGLRRVLSLLG